MHNRDNTEEIIIRRCDLHAIFSMMCIGNEGIINTAWEGVELRKPKLSRNNCQVKKGEDVAVHRLSPGATKQSGGRHKKQQCKTEVADNQPDNVPNIKKARGKK